MESAQIRRYRILAILGSGGFGTVYRAEMVTDTGLRRDVALKVLNEQTAGNPEAARRLRDEARILSHLNHRGIVRVDDLLQLEGRWTMVMELVNGVDTERLLNAHGPMPLSVALEIVADVGQTLNAAYRSTGPDGKRLGLIHRDIKPANILVTAAGGVKLLDFGVAKAEIEDREAKTQQAFVMGSLPYLAPERYAFEDLHQGDVYGLGCVLYELLTNERFGRTRPSTKRHTNKVRQALHHLWEALPNERREEVLQLLADTLTYEPDNRLSARRFAARAVELRRLVSGPSLTEWAEERVVPVLEAGNSGAAGSDSLVGRVLTHNLSGESIGAELPEEPSEAAEVATAPLPQLDEVDPEHVEVQPPSSEPVPSAPVPSEPRPDPSEAVPARTQPPPESPELAPTHWGAVVLGLGAAMFAGVAILLVAMSGVEPQMEEPIDKSPQPSLEDILETVGEEQEPEPEPEPEVQPRPDPGVRVIERPPSSERVVPVERTPPPRSEPALEGVPTGVVRVDGDADFVQLRGAGGTASPGDVPAGTWTVFPSFPGGYTVKGPTVTVVEGQTLRIRCTSTERTCTPY